MGVFISLRWTVVGRLLPLAMLLIIIPMRLVKTKEVLVECFWLLREQGLQVQTVTAISSFMSKSLVQLMYGFSAKLWTIFFFSSRRRHTRSKRDWSSDVCSSD